MKDVKISNLVLEASGSNQQAGSNNSRPRLRSILAKHAQRKDFTHHEMLNLHREGFNSLRPIYLKDGTILGDRGAFTLIQHPDNRLAVVFDHNPDNIRRVEVSKEALNSSHKVTCSELANTQDLIVINAQEKDRRGLPKAWVSRAVEEYDYLVSRGTAYYGILKRTGNNEWSSEGRTYSLVEPTPKHKKKLNIEEDDTQHKVLHCGYGIGLVAGHVAEHEKLQQKLIDLKQKITWDGMPVLPSQAYDIMAEDFEVGAPKDIQGFSPHDVTYKKDFDSEFSRHAVSIGEGNIAKKSRSYLWRKASYAGFLLASGIVREFRKTVGKTAVKSASGAAYQFAFRFFLQKAALGFAATIAAVFFAAQFIMNTVANAKKSHMLSIKDRDDKSNTFYKYKEDAEVMERRYQEADPEQMAQCRALSLEEYDCVPFDVKIYEDEPEFYDLNRFLSTNSVREGSLMEAFRLNAHDVSFYDESHGIRRVVIPDLKTAFVTYVGTKEDELEISGKQKNILDKGCVIKVSKNLRTRRFDHQVMSYEEYEKDLLYITQKEQERPLCEHPQNIAYLEQVRKKEEDKKMINRVKRRLGMG